MRKYARLATGAVSLLLSAIGSPAIAQAWPDKPVRIIVPSAAGGSPDAVARVVADKLGAMLGARFFVENRPGAGGIAGMGALKASAPDGYNFAMVPASTIVLAPHLFKSIPWTLGRDVEPVALVGISPLVIAVKNDSPYRSLGDLVGDIRANPDKINVATTATNTLPNLLAKALADQTKTKPFIIPYPNSPTALTSLLRAESKVFFDGYPTFAGMLQSGDVRLLAMFAEKRLSNFSDIPVVAETIPGLKAPGWFAFFAPKGLDAKIAAKFMASLNEVLTDREVSERLYALAVYPEKMSAEQFATFIDREVKFWAEVAGNAGVTPQ